MENKQRILDLLLPALQETRNLHDLVELEYRADAPECLPGKRSDLCTKGESYQEEQLDNIFHKTI